MLNMQKPRQRKTKNDPRRAHTLMHREARRQLLNGVDEVADMVKSTFGPGGRCIVIQQFIGYPHITRDGVTVARHIDPRDPTEKMGAALCREAAQKTDSMVGDGTTTCVILTQALLHEGFRLLEAGLEPMPLIQGLRKAVAAVEADIRRQSAAVRARVEASSSLSDVEILSKVAILAARDEEIGRLIGDALGKVGSDGIMTVAENKLRRTYVEVSSGLEIRSDFLSSAFISNPKEMSTELENPYLLISTQSMKNMEEMKRVLRWCEWEKRPLWVFAPEIDHDVQGLLLAFRNESKVRTVAVHVPGGPGGRRGPLDDLAAFTGAEIIGDEQGISLGMMEKSMLGQAERVWVGRDRSVFTGPGASDEVRETYITNLKLELKNLARQRGNDAERIDLRERIARLTGGIAVIYVGAATEMAQRELKDRVQDAIGAARVAQEGGVVWGGATAYLHAAKVLENLVAASPSEQAGIDLTRRILEVPFRQLVSNVGTSADLVIDESKSWEEGTGFDALRRTRADLLEIGLLEPAMIPVLALRHAASIAGSLFSVEALHTLARVPYVDYF
jgi:chaperonin GroEL